MTTPAGRSRAGWIAGVCLLVAFVVLPLVVVAVAPGLDEGAYVCKVEVESLLAETLEGGLEFHLVRGLEGRVPAERFVITVAHGYTAGLRQAPGGGAGSAAVAGEFWLQGTLMDRETFFGEQYLFFGRPQLYVSQVRHGVLWPSQIARLKNLYAAPLTAVGAVYLVGAFPFMEEFSGGTWALWIARLVVVCGAVAGAVWYRRRRWRWASGIVWIAGGYLLATVALAVPGL